MLSRKLNTTGRDGHVVDIPHLERQNQDGAWTEVPYKEGIGFWGTPSTLPAGGAVTLLGVFVLARMFNSEKIIFSK